MSQSASSRAYVLRREMRLRRDKTAALLLSALISHLEEGALMDKAIESAVMLTDRLLARLDETCPTRAEVAPSGEAST